jgi:hypothetical protein
MTKLVAFFILIDAQKEILSLVPQKHFITEHPDLLAAINTLRKAERELRAELKGVVR